MREILNHCRDIPNQRIPDGTVLLSEGQNTGKIYVLVDGRIEVLRGDTQIAVLDEPGSLLGEMSVLLDVPHTATARALGAAEVRIIQDGRSFFGAHPQFSWLVARLLANRLNAATTYLVDLKRQFADHGDHLEMVGEVLEFASAPTGTRFQPWVGSRSRSCLARVSSSCRPATIRRATVRRQTIAARLRRDGSAAAAAHQAAQSGCPWPKPRQLRPRMYRARYRPAAPRTGGRR